MNDIYEETFKICTWDVDREDKLTPYATFNYCQEIAGNHATILGVGTQFMREHGIVWILSRMSAELLRRPGWGTYIQARTWPRGTDRLFAVRDYELADEQGVFARGRSGWLIVDLATMRPRRPEALTADLPRNDSRAAIEDGIQGINTADGLSLRAQRGVAYSDLDYNGHVNNARYVQWIQDALDVDRLCDANSLRVDINYLAENRPGMSVDIFATEPETDAAGHERILVEGRQAPSGTPSFRSTLQLGL